MITNFPWGTAFFRKLTVRSPITLKGGRNDGLHMWWIVIIGMIIFLPAIIIWAVFDTAMEEKNKDWEKGGCWRPILGFFVVTILTLLLVFGCANLIS